MSIINQVLRDLEERRAEGPEGQPLTLDIRTVGRRRRRLDLWVVAGAVFGIAIMVLLGLAALRWNTPPPAADAKPRVHAEPAAPVAATPVAITAPPQPEATVALPPQASVANAAAPAPSVAPPLSAPAPVVAKQDTLPEASILPKVSELAKSLARPLPKPASRSAAKGFPPVAPRMPSAESTPADAPTANPAPVNSLPAVNPGITTAPEITTMPEITTAPANAVLDKRMREMPAESRAELMFRDGVSALQLGRVSEAQTHFEDALKVLPAHPSARQALIGILLDLQRYDEAERWLAGALELDPKNARYAMVLARVQVERGDNVAALRTLQGVAAVAGEDANYHGFMATVLQRLGIHDKAVEHFQTALKSSPGSAAWLTGSGISLRELGRVAEARDAYTRARAIGALSPELQLFIERQLKELQAHKG